jgi:hypothetical protein
MPDTAKGRKRGFRSKREIARFVGRASHLMPVHSGTEFLGYWDKARPTNIRTEIQTARNLQHSRTGRQLQHKILFGAIHRLFSTRLSARRGLGGNRASTRFASGLSEHHCAAELTCDGRAACAAMPDLLSDPRRPGAPGAGHTIVCTPPRWIRKFQVDGDHLASAIADISAAIETRVGREGCQ